MTHAQSWPADLTRLIGRQVRKYREQRGMSAEQLAEAVQAIGVPYTRSQVTNLEANRRTTITLGEVLAFARVLDVPPVLLFLPIGGHEDVEILPGVEANPWAAYRWITGQGPLAERYGTGDAVDYGVNLDHTDVGRFDDTARPISLYREHSAAIEQFANWHPLDTDKAMDAVKKLVRVRRDLQTLDLDVPALKGLIADVVSAQEGMSA